MKIPFDKLGFTSFSSDEEYLQLIAEEKWKEGYTCRKCGHTNYCKGKAPYSRRCTRCKHEESATSHTIFHRCRIPLTEAFTIISMVCSDPGISTYEISRKMELRQMTCWKLKSRLIRCIENKGEIDICTYLPSRKKSKPGPAAAIKQD